MNNDSWLATSFKRRRPCALSGKELLPPGISDTTRSNRATKGRVGWLYRAFFFFWSSAISIINLNLQSCKLNLAAIRARQRQSSSEVRPPASVLEESALRGAAALAMGYKFGRKMSLFNFGNTATERRVTARGKRRGSRFLLGGVGRRRRYFSTIKIGKGCARRVLEESPDTQKVG